jgi:hypothetical protein
MFKRTGRALGFQPGEASQDMGFAYSSFHWNYLLPQGMPAPIRVNRTMSAPYSGPRVNKFVGAVWVDLELHPAMRVALDPFLRRLPLTRDSFFNLERYTAQGALATPQQAAADFERIAPRVDDVATRMAWLAKVMQLCAVHGEAELGMQLWEKFGCNERYGVFAPAANAAPSSSPSSSSHSGAIPPMPLAVAVLYCTAALRSDKGADAAAKYASAIFDVARRTEARGGWNVTPRLNADVWESLLLGAGARGEEALAIAVLEELVDVQFDVDILNARSVVVAMNSVKDKTLYEKLKKLMFAFGEKKTGQLAASFTKMRTEAELSKDEAGKEAAKVLPENDNAFYHVRWHARLRAPMPFMPRQLYFDYKPTFATGGAGTTGGKEASKTAVADIVKAKIQLWKDEGLLPEDYDHAEATQGVYDKQAAWKQAMRAEKWKKKPTWIMKEELGYSPGV